MFKKALKVGLVTAVASISMFMMSCVGDDGDAYVRFTWRTSDQPSIESISVSYDDVEYARGILEDLGCGYLPDGDFECDNLDGKDYSINDWIWFRGSDELPDNMYSKTTGSTGNKGRYFKISAGKYSAVCSGEDQYGYWDIVANYEIKVNKGDFDGDGADQWFEVAFDVNEFLNTTAGEWEWDDFWVADNANTNPQLTKAKAVKAKVAKAGDTRVSRSGGSTMTVDYYVIRRPKI